MIVNVEGLSCYIWTSPSISTKLPSHSSNFFTSLVNHSGTVRACITFCDIIMVTSFKFDWVYLPNAISIIPHAELEVGFSLPVQLGPEYPWRHSQE